MIPENWVEIPLKDVCEVLDSRRIPVNSSERANRIGDVPYYGATGQVGWIDDYLFDEELVLLGEDGAPFFDKSKSIAYIVRGKSWVNNHAHVIRAIEDATSNRYIKYFLDQFDFTDYVNGTTRLKLTQEAMNRIPISLAPLNEQRRIVEKLDELMERLATARAKLERVSCLLAHFRRAVLAAACSGALTRDWREKNEILDFEETTIEDITDYVGGFAYKSPAFLETGEHQVIRIGNVRPFQLKLNAAPVFIPQDIAEQTSRFKLLPNDIAISMTGTKYKKDYGFAAIVRDSDGSLFLNQRVSRLRCREGIIPEFLLYWLQSDYFRGFFFAEETGNVNQGNVGADGIRKAPINLPPLPEQREIVRRVNELFALADSLEAHFTKAKAFFDRMPGALLAKAFRGELVPQNPNDEPASLLLERLRGTREGVGKPAQKAPSGQATMGAGLPARRKRQSKQMALPGVESGD